MTLLRSSIKTLLATAMFAAMADSAAAARFQVKRGLNMDIWQTWPGGERWGDREVVLPFPEWRKTVDASDLRKLRETGFDFLRVPVDPGVFLSDATSGFRDELVASLVGSVRLANGAGLKVLVDLHSYPQGTGDRIGTNEIQSDKAVFDRYLELIRSIAKALSAINPELVALETMNEPTVGCENRRQWEDMQYQLYAAARSSAPRLSLVLSGGCWADAESLVTIEPDTFPDDNVLWTFHSYAPFILTHQGASWTGGFISEVVGLPYPPDAVPKAEFDYKVDQIGERIDTSKSEAIPAGTRSYFEQLIGEIDTPEKLSAVIAAPIDEVARWALQHRIDPGDILLGEFGMIRQEYGQNSVVPAEYRAAYYRDVIGNAERNGIAWAMWGYGGAFGVVEEFDGRPAEPEVVDMIRALPETAGQ